MARKKLHLLIIDPQNDFCDMPDDYRPLGADARRQAPALPVPGAHADLLRVAALIDRGGAGLTDISVTLDSHQRLDIGHPTFWRQADGSPVQPFTPIRAVDVRTGIYVPRQAGASERVVAYLEALEGAGRYVHMVWPIHCEIGTWGQNVHDDVRRAYNRWEEAQVAVVAKVAKGSNPWTEHYSAIKAEVPDPEDNDTLLNAAFLERLRQAERIYVAGEAGSHCVKATVEHIVENFAPAEWSKLVLLVDCMSPVTGFEAQYEAFVADMQARGVQVATSTDVLPELLANAREGG